MALNENGSTFNESMSQSMHPELRSPPRTKYYSLLKKDFGSLMRGESVEELWVEPYEDSRLRLG